MTYMNAELELIRFAAEDVLATSTDPVTTSKCGAGEDIEFEEDSFE